MKSKAAPFQTSAFGALLLILPVVFGAFTFFYGFSSPFNSLKFISEGLQISLGLFLVVWTLSFWNRFWSKRAAIWTSVFLVLWLFSSVPFLAVVNRIGASSASAVKKSSKVIEAREVKAAAGIRGSSKGSCVLTFEEEIEGLKTKDIREDYCQTIRPGTDKIEFSLRSGLLGWAFVEDITVLRGP